MTANLTAYLAAVAAVLALSYVFRKGIGKMLNALIMPRGDLRVGSKVRIYHDGEYNRTATIDNVVDDDLIIYGRLALPIGFRGKFYAIGYNQSREKFVYVSNKGHYKFVALAEIIRKVCSLPDYCHTLPNNPDGSAILEEAMAEGEDEGKEAGNEM